MIETGSVEPPAAKLASELRSKLTLIRIVHTLVWGMFVACILAIWIFAWSGSLGYAMWPIGIVAIEVVILLVNGLHCPLTPIAARFTNDRRANFDIYLPEWLARHNVVIFGALYTAGVIYTLAKWAHHG